MKTLTYFVPVDFSQCSYNALQYATMLARFSGGKVKLFHVIDLEEIPDSGNPVVVSWALERLAKKAAEKMRSLREIIGLEGTPVEQEIVMGNVRLEIMEQIDKVKPHVIVIGRNTDTRPKAHSLVSYITRNTRVPVLVVPGSHNPKIPNRAVLATDLRPDKIGEFAPFFEIIKKSSQEQELSILNIKRNSSSNGKQAEDWLNRLKATYGISARLLRYENDNVLSGVIEFIRKNEVDLLCTVKRSHGFPEKFFHRSISSQLASELEVPVLVINE